MVKVKAFCKNTFFNQFLIKDYNSSVYLVKKGNQMTKCLNKSVINYGKREDLCFNDIQVIRDDETGFESHFKAEKVNVMPGKEKGFNKTQIEQLTGIVKSIVIDLLNELVIPRFEVIENCPTIKKELKKN